MLIKESVHDTVRNEMTALRSMMMPFVSQQEQRDIERRYKKPSRKSVQRTTIKI